jgi:hypothetical protein
MNEASRISPIHPGFKRQQFAFSIESEPRLSREKVAHHHPVLFRFKTASAVD